MVTLQSFKLSLAAVALLGGCAALGGKTDIDNLGDARATVVSYEAESRGAYFAHAGVDAQYCAEPPPDVALNRSLELAGEVSGETKGVELSAEARAALASNAVQLAGRTQIVLLARELLYRTCELALNGHLNSTDVKANFEKVVELVEMLGTAEVADSEQRLLQTQERLENLAREDGVTID